MQVHKASCIKIQYRFLIGLIHPRVRDIPSQKPDGLENYGSTKILSAIKTADLILTKN